MPIYSKKITDSEVPKLSIPTGEYAIYWCPAEKGLGVKVTYAGGSSWVFERFKDGKTVRRTLGKAAGRGAISRAAAVEIMREVSAEQQQGIDRVRVKREQIKESREKSITFSEAMSDYVKNKRRAKDGLPLKERTKEDYLAMLAPATYKENGEMRKKPGGLHAIADRSIYEIDADTIRSIYKSGSNQRQCDYSMQVLRAVLHHQRDYHHGHRPGGTGHHARAPTEQSGQGADDKGPVEPHQRVELGHQGEGDAFGYQGKRGGQPGQDIGA